MSTITLSDGSTVVFSRRRYGIVITLPNGDRVGPQQFLRHLVDACAESGRSIAHLLDQLGIEDDGACGLCASGLPRTLCPSCGCVARCAACAPSHDNRSLCRLTQEYADLHRRMRDGDSIEAQDRYHAVKSLASAYERRMVQ